MKIYVYTKTLLSMWTGNWDTKIFAVRTDLVDYGDLVDEVQIWQDGHLTLTICRGTSEWKELHG